MIKQLLALLLGLQVADGVLTWWAVSAGMAQEWNSCVANLAGSWYFPVIKVAGAIVSALALWGVYGRFPKTALMGAGSIVVLYSTILVWNSGIILFS